MIRLVTLLFFYILCYSVEAKLVFSLKKVVEYDDFKQRSVFTLLDNGKYSFKSTTGGFHLCSNSPSGSFNGKLNEKNTQDLIKYFKDMDQSCSELSSCSTRKVQNSYDWSLLGWGDYSDKQYFLSNDTKRPKLLTKIFNLEKQFYQIPEFSIEIKKGKITKNQINLNIKYLGKDHFEFIGNNSSFVVFDKNKQRRLKSKVQKSINIQSGKTIKFSIDKMSNDLKEGDYLIYSPLHKSEISACIVI